MITPQRLSRPKLSADQIQDLRLAASKMSGVKRRAFQAEMTLKYCGGSARQAKSVFGWSPAAVRVGLEEKRTGLICYGAQPAYSGCPRWEEQYPGEARMLVELAEAQAQQDPTFGSTLAYTRLTAAAALQALRERGISEDRLPSPSTMARVLNRLGYRLRKVIKAKPLKKIKETDAIFDNIKAKDNALARRPTQVKRLSMDCKATVKPGPFSRGGLTRGDHRASDHDFGAQGSYTPFGIVDEDSGELLIHFGSSCKTSDFIVDSVQGWWDGLGAPAQTQLDLLQIKIDNGPESSGVRTQFLNRMVEFADAIGKPIQLLYYPPYHSKYNPIERCWGILEQHWNGALLIDVETMLGWARTMTWKGLTPVIELNREVYQKGVSLSKKAMRAVEARLQRSPLLPKWDIFIRPATAT
jgi:hypothetical protein